MIKVYTVQTESLVRETIREDIVTQRDSKITGNRRCQETKTIVDNISKGSENEEMFSFFNFEVVR